MVRGEGNLYLDDEKERRVHLDLDLDLIGHRDFSLLRVIVCDYNHPVIDSDKK